MVYPESWKQRSNIVMPKVGRVNTEVGRADRITSHRPWRADAPELQGSGWTGRYRRSSLSRSQASAATPA